MRAPHLFVLPYEEANFVDVHRILWHATHASDLVAIVDDSLFFRKEFLATVDYYKSIGRLDFIDLLPKAGYAMPEEYHVKTACYGRLSSEIGIYAPDLMGLPLCRAAKVPPSSPKTENSTL